MRGDWERSRWVAAILVNMSGKTLPKGKNLKPIDLGIFPWEEPPKPHVYGFKSISGKVGETREERHARWDREMKEHFEKVKNGSR